ncbi:MAG: LysR family transcriptional regulator [Pseudomonadota bacterium]
MTEPDTSMLLDRIFYDRACWRDVFRFLKVVEAGSFRKGAAEARASLNTTRDAVAQLERLAGARLLDRGTEGVMTTSAGGRVVELARGIEKVFARAAAGKTPFPDDTENDDAPPEGGAPVSS